MMQRILDWTREIMDTARQTYGVNPIVFLALLTGCSPFFYFSIYRLVRAAAGKLNREIGLWSAVFLASTAAPYLYVMVFGRNLPVWVYGILVLLLGQGVVSLARKLRTKRPKAGKSPS